MFHFFDPLHVKTTPSTGEVLLAVRVTDNRVDEYRLPLEVFEEMLTAFEEHSAEWGGPETLRVKVDDGHQLVGLSVQVCTGTVSKREVHRLGLSQFEVMAAQFRAQVRG
jgi:hypothetical protein